MANFKLEYKLIGPQTYDRGDVGEKATKLAKDTQRGSITVNATNLDDAKKKAKPLIKNLKSFERFSSRFSFDSPRKPGIRFLKGAGGSSGDSPIKEIETKLLIKPKKYGQKDLL